MNYSVIWERVKTAIVNPSWLRSSISSAALSSLLVIGWTLAPKELIPPSVNFVLTMFAVLMLPGMWFLWAFPELAGGDWLKSLPLAFTLSYALWSIPIFLIMTVHASWETFTILFFTLSFLFPLLAIFLSSRSTPDHTMRHEKLNPGNLLRKVRSNGLYPSHLLLLVLVLVCAAAVIPLSSSGYVDGDVLTHVAMIRNVLESPNFSIEEPLFGAGLPVPTRGAANPWLLLPAFMSRVSGIDPLPLINTYLPPLLAILAIMTVYLLVYELSGKRSLALFTTAFFVIYLASEPFHRHGNQSYILFRRIISDKHFLLAVLLPVGIVFAHRYLRVGQARFLMFFGLTGLGIAFTHSLVTLFLLISTSVFATGYFLIDWINQQTFIRRHAWRVAALVVITSLLMTIPLLQSRKESNRISYLFLKDLANLSLVKDETLVSPITSVSSLGVPGQKVPNLGEIQVENANPYLVRRLYGQLKAKGLLVLSPTVFMSHPDLLWDLGVILALILTPFLLLWVRKDNLALYLFAITLTYPLINFNPFVAPLAGRFVTPWLLYRFTWPIPVTLTLAYFLFKFAEWFERPYSRHQLRKFSLRGLTAVLLLLMVASWLRPSIQEFAASLLDKRNPTQVFSQNLISFLRQKVSTAPEAGVPAEVLLSDYSTNLIFAAFFDRPNLVAHRYNTTSEEFIVSRQDEALQRSLDVDYFTSAQWLDNRVVEMLRRYQVNYVLVRSNRALNCQLSFYPSALEELYRDEAYTLYQVKRPIKDDRTIQANSWMLEGNLESAFSAYQDGLKNNPASLPALIGIAEVYARNGEPSLALDSLLQASKVSKGNSCTLQSLANGYFNTGDLNQAMEYYRQAISAAPWDEHLSRALGDLYLLQDRFDEAKSAYIQSIQVQLDIDPFSFKEIHSTQETKTGVPAGEPDATSEEDNPRIPNYNEAVAEFFRNKGIDYQEETVAVASLQTDASDVSDLTSRSADQEKANGNRLDSLHYYQAGNNFLSQQKFDEAITAYRKAIQSGLLKLDWSLDARMAVGLAFKDMGSLNTAVESFEEIPNYISSVTEPYLEIAKIYHDQGENEEALKVYDQAIQIYPEDIRAFLGKSDIFLEQGNEVLALEEYEKALEVNPRSSLAWNAIGELYIKQGKLDQARQAFFKSLELTPDNEASYLGLATVYQQENRIDAMLSNARQAIINSPNSSNNYLYLGDAYLAKKQTNLAITAYKRAITLNPVEAGAYSKLASIRPSPGFIADMAAQINSSTFRGEPSGSVWSVLANTYAQQADFIQAKTFYQRAIETDPSLSRAYVGLAELSLIISNDRESALNYFQQAIESDPDSFRAYSDLANFYLDQGQLETARQAYEDLVREFPNQVVGYLGLSSVYRRSGNLESALDTLRLSVESNPVSAEAYMAYADQLLQNGDLPSAQTMYREGLRIDPGVVNSLSVIERIVKVLGNRDEILSLIISPDSEKTLLAREKVALALFYEYEGDYERTENLLVEVMNEDSLNPANLLQLSRFYQRRERWKEANQLLQQALALAPFNSTISLEIAYTYAGMNSFKEAEVWNQKTQNLDQSDPSAAIGLAELNKTRGDWETAQLSLEKAVKIAPNDPLVHIALGDLYKEIGNLSTAEKEYKTACELDKSQLSCYNSLGLIYEITQRWADAIKVYAQITHYAPYEASGYANLARIFQSIGQVENAGRILNNGLNESLDKGLILDSRAELSASQRLWEQAQNEYETAWKSENDSLSSGIRLALFLTRRGLWEEALGVLLSTDKLPGSGAVSKVALGDYYSQRADWEAARISYQAALEIDATITEAAFGLDRVYRMLGQPEQSSQVKRSILNFSPDKPELYLAIGDEELNQGDISAANIAYQKALELAPTFIAAYWRIENVSHILNNQEKHLAHLESLVNREPTPDLLVELGQLYLTEGKWDEAFSLYQQSVARYPEHGESWLAIGKYYQYFGEWEKALDAFERSIQLEPASYLTWLSKGSVLQTQDRFDEALKCYNVASEIDSSQISSYIAKANLLIETGQRETAINTLRQGVQADPTSNEGYIHLSELFLDNNESQNALETIQLGISVLPGSAELYAIRGNILRQLAIDLQEKFKPSQTNDPDTQNMLQEIPTSNLVETQRIQFLFDEASLAYGKALEIQPINATALMGQGQIAALESDHEKALEYFTRAARFNPLMDKVWISIGEYYLQVKDWQKANDAFLRAMILSPSNPRARVGLSSAMAELKLSDSSSAAFSIQNSLFLWDRIIQNSARPLSRTGRLQ